MNTTTRFLVLAAMAGPAAAQSNSAPRPMPPVPFQSSAKVQAAVQVATPAPERLVPDGARRHVPAYKPFEAEGRRSPAPALDRLHWTTTQQGEHWVLGPTYKAGFGPDGAVYVPFLGSAAPRNFPLALSLAAATVDGQAIELEPISGAVRDGDRVVIDRGVIDEVYEIGLESIEQTFVVAERPAAAGDLRLYVRLESELERSATSTGSRFANDLGGVDYSDAFVREADGDRVPLATRATEGGVEIVVAAEYLATASFPLVVDPVISTFAVDTITADHVESDVAHDESTGRWLVVYERAFSATDGDIEVQLRNDSGTGVAVQYIDATTQNFRTPHAANQSLANQFLCVMQVTGYPGVPGSTIIGVTVNAINGAQGSQFVISTTDQPGDKILPDVGGDPYTGGAAYYCVVWRRNFSATDYDIHARLVQTDGALVGTGTILIDNSAGSKDSWPSISKSNGTQGSSAAWTIAWHREISATNVDIHAARINYAGTILNPSAPVITTSGEEAYPRVTSPLDDGRVLLAYSVDFGDHDIWYALLTGTTGVANGSLSGLESGTTLFQDQIEYSVDSDGQRFVVAYAEQFGTSTTDYDIYASTFAPSGASLVCLEAHQTLDFSSAQSLRTDVCAKHSGGQLNTRRCYVSWDTLVGTGNHDLYGALYDAQLNGFEVYCDGLNTGAASCPCGNDGDAGAGCGNSANLAGATLSASGTPDVSSDTVSLAVARVPAGVTCTLFQGTTQTSLVFGDGVRCAGGTLIRIRTKPASAGGTATWPTGAENDISVTGLLPATGGLRHYQVTYRNSAFFCVPATFNISNGVSVQWTP